MTQIRKQDPYQLGPLLERSLTGDGVALNDLVGRLRGYLHALARRWIGPEDNVKLGHSSLVQEALLRVSQNLGGLRSPTVPHLLNWAGRILHNLIADALRALGRRPPVVPIDHVPDTPGKGPTPQTRAEGDERAVLIADALQKLPEKQRQAVELRFFDHLPDAEIGRLLGGSEEAVRILRFRGLRRLRELVPELAPEGAPAPFSKEAPQ
ncbi:MAG: RNA polymerase sigma factor [Gemmataceae bacterium]|nr:RNA polymerase sigma factor [Gemmataceae bacterium]